MLLSKRIEESKDKKNITPTDIRWFRKHLRPLIYDALIRIKNVKNVVDVAKLAPIGYDWYLFFYKFIPFNYLNFHEKMPKGVKILLKLERKSEHQLIKDLATNFGVKWFQDSNHKAEIKHWIAIVKQFEYEMMN